jgi:1-acyl-sn-glycerol-3-phosphate acyltransferase
MQIKKLIKSLNPLKKDMFGNYDHIKRLIISTLGVMTYRGLNWANKTKVEGTEYLKNLPDTNVLFVSNHQTYFKDVIAISHVFTSVKWGFNNSIKNPISFLAPRVNTYFIAAKETMKSGFLPKIFEYAGSVSIKRTWREAGKEIKRKVEETDISNITKALKSGWVITFPQGTTEPFAPGRIGTAHIIKTCNPIVIPVVIDGFRKAFDKKGLILKEKKTELSIRFKEALNYENCKTSEEILEMVMDAIEQSSSFAAIKSFN